MGGMNKSSRNFGILIGYALCWLMMDGQRLLQWVKCKLMIDGAIRNSVLSEVWANFGVVQVLSLALLISALVLAFQRRRGALILAAIQAFLVMADGCMSFCWEIAVASSACFVVSSAVFGLLFAFWARQASASLVPAHADMPERGFGMVCGFAGAVVLFS